MKQILTLLFSLYFCCVYIAKAQDTFSIVAVDPVTGEVGSAGASCVDLFNYPTLSVDFLGELFPGVGAINTQSYYHPTNQEYARNRMDAGDTPSEIITWLINNDVSGDPSVRQYGIVRLVNGVPQSAAFTGDNCMNEKGHITGASYSIQGNILSGVNVLTAMEAKFNSEPGDLACKLMAALQGANTVGADSRCAPNGTSSLFAFVKVSKPTDQFGDPSFVLSVKTRDNAGIEPIDSLQKLFNDARNCSITGISYLSNDENIRIYPNPASNKIVIDSKNASAAYVVKDCLGKEITNGLILNQLELDLTTWRNGIYFIEISVGQKKSIRKIVKI